MLSSESSQLLESSDKKGFGQGSARDQLKDVDHERLPRMRFNPFSARMHSKMVAR